MHEIWTRSRVAAAIAFCTIAALQLLVPLSRLNTDGPTRFGWQMFSRPSFPVIAVAYYREGIADTVRWSDHVARPRPEIDFVAHLPDHLCRVLPDAERVTVTQSGRAVERACR